MTENILSLKSKERKVCFFYLLSICVLFYILNIFTPLRSDDWHYNFIYGTQNPITSISDIIESQWAHYNLCNGRFVPHFFVQLFDGILGKNIFNVANTLFLFLFLFLIAKLIQKEIKSFYTSISLVTAFIFLFLPGFKNNFLWMSGACNYLWSAVFILYFHILLNNNITSAKYYPFLFLYGLVVGWTNEALVVGIAAGYFFYYLFHSKRLTYSKSILLIGFYIGCLFLVFSPGSLHRALDYSSSSSNFWGFVSKYARLLLAMNSLRIMFILLIAFCFVYKKIKIREFITNNQIWIIAICVLFIFILFTGHTSIHSKFGIELFSLILLLKLISVFNIRNILLYASNILVVFLLIYANYFAYLNFRDYNSCVKQITNTNNELILTNPIELDPKIRRFVITDFSMCDFGNNQWIANRFGKKCVRFIPEKLFDEIVQQPTHFLSFNIPTEYPYYIQEMELGQEVTSVVFDLKKVNPQDVFLLVRPFIKHFDRYTLDKVDASFFSILEINNRNYLFVAKNPFVDNRLKTIIVN